MIPQHYVHRLHIIQLLLIMILTVLKKKVKKYNLLVIIILLELREIVPPHKMQYNLMKHEIGYNVHTAMHVQQLNLVLIAGNMNCDLEISKRERKCAIVAHNYNTILV